jgi:Tfp pilus assembly protein PilO
MTSHHIGEYIAIGTFFVTMLGVVWRISHILNKKVSYESLDRCKKEVQDNFVSKDVFILSYNTMREDIVEIKQDVKKLLQK